MSGYPFVNVPITPSVASYLIASMFKGKTVHRGDIINTVTERHRELGGIVEGSVTSSVKKALQSMAKRGEVENLPAVGYWKVFVDDSVVEEAQQNAHFNTLQVTEEEHVSITAPSYQVVGSGDESIYLYWFESYKELAKLRDIPFWKCKVGRSSGSVVERINEQCGTSNPEKPIVGLVIKTLDSVKLEKLLHDVLKFKNKHVQDAVGKEWFITSPSEVLSIYYFLLI